MRDGASPGVKLPGMEPPITEAPQRQLKTQRRKVPPPSKVSWLLLDKSLFVKQAGSIKVTPLSPSLSSQIPSSAVEMPGSADISGLNVQFGALDFGSEAGSGGVEVAQTESVREQAPVQAPAPAPMPVPTAIPTQQPQSSLFSKPASMRCVRDLFSVGASITNLKFQILSLSRIMRLSRFLLFS